VLRFHARCPWRNENTGCTDYIAALIVPFRRIDDDAITGIHRIRLDQPDRWPKADRRMLGIVARAAVKLDQLSCERLVIAEGIETAIRWGRPMIRAEITGFDVASACGIAVHGSPPVIKLCGALVAAGHDPAEPMEAYRGATLCLRVRSIGEAAQLEVKPGGGGFRRVAQPMRGSPVRGNGQAATSIAADALDAPTATVAVPNDRGAT
jgi:hypothetical protein